VGVIHSINEMVEVGRCAAGIVSRVSCPGFPRWRCVFLTAAVKYDIKINAVLTI
jgi:hypothetical protein